MPTHQKIDGILSTYIRDTFFRMRTSFSTFKSSKICDINWFFRNVCRHIGQGAGPALNKRSIHDSHLPNGKHLSAMAITDSKSWFKLTFCGNTAIPGVWGWEWGTCHSCIQDIERPLPGWRRRRLDRHSACTMLNGRGTWYDMTVAAPWRILVEFCCGLPKPLDLLAFRCWAIMEDSKERGG